jgi:tRNA(Ile2) C34 agmatinyltransferase TiaS
VPRSKNYAGPQPQVDNKKPVDKVGINGAELKNVYRWNNLRVYKDMTGVKTDPIDKELLEQTRCRRRTCRKVFKSSFEGQYLCNTCMEKVKKKQKKLRIEKQLRSIKSN